MFGITFLCFLQGVEEPFLVAVDETDMINHLKEGILSRRRGIIRENAETFKIWKVFIPVNEYNKLRNPPVEIESGEELEGSQRITSIGEVRNEYIQVFMENPDSVIIPPTLTKQVKETDNKIKGLENKIQGLENKIQGLANIIQSVASIDGAGVEMDCYLEEICKLGVIKVSDELHIKKGYSEDPKPVKIGCRVIGIDNGIFTVTLIGYDEERKIITSLVLLEIWLLNKFNLDKQYRPKYYSRPDENIDIIRNGEDMGNVKKRYKELKK
ncbi:16097_t:CDS:2 [Funneliformis mosseae]|uniref:16097_t:CDS:1 n=1 Tax=Funneliformis mosseae TaxID=27381 RepID=A0A9N9AJN0_FUNMO|nr:16097_t:CDS:2 [Funneliformis mosseae]